MDEAKTYLLDYLKNKYDEEFIVIGNEPEREPNKYTGTVYYHIDFAPQNNPEQVFSGVVSSDDFPFIIAEDDYAKYIFKEEAEAICGDICATYDFIESYTVELKGEQTSARWTKNDSLQKYMGRGTINDSYNYVTVYLKDGLTDEEYAQQISDLMSDLVLAPCAIFIDVWANGEIIYRNNIFVDYKPGHDVARALEKIYNDRITQEQNARNEARGVTN